MGQAREVMDRLTTLAVEEHDLNSALNCYAEDAVVTTPDAGEIRGRDNIADYWRQFVDAFPDSHYEHLGRYEAGGTAIDEGYYVGTHLAAMTTPSGETVPPTGRQIRLRSCDVATVAAGRIVEHHLYFDQADLLDQLGLAH
jgi:ketosteroid isomerase-like protein